jgi:hypothetical protein
MVPHPCQLESGGAYRGDALHSHGAHAAESCGGLIEEETCQFRDDRFSGLGSQIRSLKPRNWRITQKLFGYSTRISFMTAPDGFWVSTSAFPFTTNSYCLLAPMANSLFATMAFVASMLAVTVYVPELR